MEEMCMRRFLCGVRFWLAVFFACVMVAGNAGTAWAAESEGAVENQAEADTAVWDVVPVYKIYVHKVSHTLEL